MKESHFRFWSRYSRQYLYFPRDKSINSSLLTLFACVVLITVSVVPTFKAILNKHRLIKERESIIRKLSQKGKVIESLRITYNANLDKIVKLDALIPNNDGIPDLMEDLSIKSAKHGLELTYLSPKKTTRDKEMEFVLAADFAGNLQATLNFVKELEESERFIGVRSLNLGVLLDGSGIVRGELIVYSFNRN